MSRVLLLLTAIGIGIVATGCDFRVVLDDAEREYLAIDDCRECTERVETVFVEEEVVYEEPGGWGWLDIFWLDDGGYTYEEEVIVEEEVYYDEYYDDSYYYEDPYYYDDPYYYEEPYYDEYDDYEDWYGDEDYYYDGWYYDPYTDEWYYDPYW